MFCFLFMQAIVIIVSFSYSSMIIKDSFEDWNNNPILTTTEEIGASLTEVDFPTTTICHEPKYQVDNWALPELILNFLSFNCWSKRTKCEHTEELRQDFKALLDYVYNNISTSVETSQIDIAELNDYFFGILKNYNLYGKHMWKWLASNVTSIEEIEEILKNSTGRYGNGAKYMLRHIVFFRMYLAKLMPKSPNMPKCKEKCEEHYSKMSKIWLKAISLSTSHLGLGTLYRHFAPSLGITHKTRNIKVYDNDEIQPYDIMVNDNFISENGSVFISYIDFKKITGMGFDCNSLTHNEVSFHSIATKTGLAISGLNISLIDYPNFFKVEPTEEEQARPILTYPINSWCKQGPAIYYDSFEQYGIKWCPQEWMKTIEYSEQANENPYVKIPNDFCTKGTKNITGSELDVIYKVMKFAYHFYTEEDVQFLHDKVNESKPSYNMNSYKDFNTSWISRRPYFIESSGYDNKPHKPVMTNTGLCFAWNQRRISDVFKTSYGLQSFESELIGNVTSKKPERASIKKIEIFLDKDEMTYPDRIKSPKSFW